MVRCCLGSITYSHWFLIEQTEKVFSRSIIIIIIINLF